MAEKVEAALGGRDITVARSSPLERARETLARSPPALGLDPGEDERLIESDNVSRATHEAWKNPSYWRYLTTRYGRRGASRTARSPRACSRPAPMRGDAAGDAEAVLVSHQLPIWSRALPAKESGLCIGRNRRECRARSSPRCVYESGEVVEVRYEEPAGSLDAEPSAGRVDRIRVVEPKEPMPAFPSAATAVVTLLVVALSACAGT